MKRNPMHDAGPIDEDLKSHAEGQDDLEAPQDGETRAARAAARESQSDTKPVAQDAARPEAQAESDASQDSGGDARVVAPVPRERRKVRHPGNDEPNEDRPASERELADQAAQRYKSSGANRELQQDPNRGMEGGKIQRNQEDHITREVDGTPPVSAPKDDIA